jgi:transcriptional regulator with XRE-family HTH domain
MFRQHVGETMLRLRKARGWTQRDLALRANVSTGTINQIELAKQNSPPETLDQILRALGTSLDEVLADKYPRTQPRARTMDRVLQRLPDDLRDTFTQMLAWAQDYSLLRRSKRGRPRKNAQDIPIQEVRIIGRGAGPFDEKTVMENIEGSIFIDQVLFPFDELFIVKVKDDHLVDEGILEGDYAIIRRQPEVRSPDIAAVLTDGEVVLKPVQAAEETERSEPIPRGIESPRPKEKILGQLIGVLRKFG